MNETIALGGRRVRGFGLGGEGTPPTTAAEVLALRRGESVDPPNNTVAGAVIGAGATAFGSLLVSALAGGVRWPVVAAMTVGGGVVGALVGSKSAAAAQPPPPGIQTGPVSLTVSDPPVIQGVNASPGTVVTLNLPAGATWQNVSVGVPGNEFMGNMVKAGTATPVTVTVPPAAGATIDATWTTADGKAHFQAIVALPPGASLATPVTDPTAVSAVQNVINTVAAGGGNAAIGLQPVPVNGSASDPDFVSQLAKAQSFLNAEFAKMGRTAGLPTNGLLDYGTYSIFSVPL